MMDDSGNSVRNLHPAYFAMVMATGIVSIAAKLHGMELVATSLFWLNLFIFAILWLLVFVRLTRYPQNFLSDLFDHQRGMGFFTTIAGTCVLGSQFILILEDYQTARLLWFLGIFLGTVLTYTIFTGLAIKEMKPGLAQGIDGGWLVSVVATQSVSVLGGLLAPRFEAYQELVIFFSLCLWLFGGMLYIWLISLIFYRYYFFKFSPSDLRPPYWINMGAMAISALAGTILITNVPRSPLLYEILPFLKSFTLFFWSTGTWWIPMLLILGIWRHVCKRFKLSYDPLYWGAVFPLGMYTTSTFQLSKLLNFPFLSEIAKCFIYIALLAWGIAFFGLIHSLVSGLLKESFQLRSYRR